VQQVWAEVLDLDAFGPDDDFFELGGNSLIVAAAVARLGERLGIDLPLRALFEAPTPAEMAELIAERRSNQEHGPIDGISPFFPNWAVRLQRHGDRRPVFVFPPAEGGIWELYGPALIAARVGRDHPFWGFRRDHPDLEHVRRNGIEALAAEYARQMRIIQGRGPFLLYAVCGGGLVAWESARQLLAAGEEIAGILFHEVDLRPDSAELPPAKTSANTTSSESPVPYRPPALPVDLTLLMTATWQARGGSAGWPQLAQGSGATIVMPGGSVYRHLLYLDELGRGHLNLIVKHVRNWIEKSEARARAA
jgi:acyl carrier protein